MRKDDIIECMEIGQRRSELFLAREHTESKDSELFEVFQNGTNPIVAPDEICQVFANMDETAITYSIGPTHEYVHKNQRRSRVLKCVDEKKRVTGIFCACQHGEFLPSMIILKHSHSSLGYDIEYVENTISWEKTQEIINMIALRIIGKLNERYNDLASALQWSTITGQVFDSRFIYLYAWKFWEKQGIDAKELLACNAWEEIFNTPEEAAKMSIESKVNTRMSDTAREQGRIWGKKHKMEVLIAERLLSAAFEIEFPSVNEMGRIALELTNDESGTIPPATKSLAISWARLHPEEMNEAKDAMYLKESEIFHKQFGERTPGIAVRIINQFGSNDEMAWEIHANHWKAFNSEEYKQAQDKFITEKKEEFVEEFPNYTAMEAASVIENHTLSSLVIDPDVQQELFVENEAFIRAKCWGLLNQGLLRAAKAKLDTKNAKQVLLLWPELENVTDSWRKGKYHCHSLPSLSLPPSVSGTEQSSSFLSAAAAVSMGSLLTPTGTDSLLS